MNAGEMGMMTAMRTVLERYGERGEQNKCTFLWMYLIRAICTKAMGIVERIWDTQYPC